ncbi:MAG: ABC transporter substrate-binding protein [Euryarchaeota archaeon]|nr:ABC transporter substrate-binding protein [Euryarchaeota archaeon]
MALPKEPLTRRTLLTGTAGVFAGSAGCLSRFQASVDRETPEQVTVSIATLPADENSVPVRIANHLAETLGVAGIDAGVQPVTAENLWRSLLLNQDFDLYIGQHPGYTDPDYLYGLLHSRFSEEPGWQNPFGYVNVPGMDDPLEAQRRARTADRADSLSEIVEAVREEVPFSVIAYPQEPRAVRTDRYSGWDYRSLESPVGYLALDERSGEEHNGRDAETLTVGITDRRITHNLNPLAVEYRSRWIVTGLLYDSLGRRIDDEIEPWLARDWTWDGNRLQVELRDGLTWHDGETLTAADVAFTYRLLWDTTHTEGDPTVPAPCFRSRSTLVENVEVTGERTIELTTETDADHGLESAMVPVLPAHIWEERTDLTSIAGFDLDNATEALVDDNIEPVGSGPLRFDSVTADDRLELVRNDDHFLTWIGNNDPLAALAGGPPYERLVFIYSPSQANVIEGVQAGDLDASADGVVPTEIERAEGASEVELEFEDVSAYYHLGFNTRNAPLSNPRFRSAVSRLLDREYLRTEVFDGYATPAFSPIAMGGPEDEWEPNHRMGFIGESGTGAVDEETVHELFREAGYIYNESGELVVR